MRALLQEIGTKLDLAFIKHSLVRSTVFEDNQGCLSLVNVPKMSPRNNYLALKYHFFPSHIGKEEGIEAKYINTLEQRANILTKPGTSPVSVHCDPAAVDGLVVVCLAHMFVSYVCIVLYGFHPDTERECDDIVKLAY
jgi:hypothetical protein